MADPASFAKLVPGFDFLQGLMTSAGQGLPSMNQWIAPTLDPDELDKRIRDLRTVQFWLEQNAKMIAATVQALEVQRMTLATLKTMNLPMAELRESMQAPAPAEPDAQAEPPPKPARGKSAGATKTAPASTGGIDPMQWWSALTQQFGELATQALKDMPAAAAAVTGGAAPSPAPADTPPAAAATPARAPARRRSGNARR